MSSPPLISKYAHVLSVRLILVIGLMALVVISVVHVTSLSAHIGKHDHHTFDSPHDSPWMSSGLTLAHLSDEHNVPIPRRPDGSAMSVEDRLRYLEMKFNAYANFGVRDPFIGTHKQPSTCKIKSKLDEFGCKEGWEAVNEQNVHNKCPGYFDHVVCLDDLPKPTVFQLGSTKAKKRDTSPCLVYDFGVRAQPQFGAVMARTFGCEVHAFDPSPVSTKWWGSKEAEEIRKLPNYHFHPYGAGGVDGSITLNEYNWGQVSIVKYPSMLLDCGQLWNETGNCNVKSGPVRQGSMELDVKTLPTIMRELKHEGRQIDVLKIDVEGSEFAFLENLLDSQGGCPNFIQQLTLEWHHFSFDVRYGDGSSPPINAIATLLQSCGLGLWDIYGAGGWPSVERDYVKMGLRDMRYNVASFRREPKIKRVFG